MLTSDWGSDMCSSDLRHRALLSRDIRPLKAAAAILAIAAAVLRRLHLMVDEDDLARHQMIGRRDERVEARKIGDLALDHIGSGRSAVPERRTRKLLRVKGTDQRCSLIAAHPARHPLGLLADIVDTHVGPPLYRPSPPP